MQTRVHQYRRDRAEWLELRADDPTKPATLDWIVLDALDDALDRIGLSDARAVVLDSPGSKYFVVGANINALRTLDRQTMDQWVNRGHEVFAKLERLPLLTLAAVDGIALGGGLELALACDVILATETSRFGMPEATLGLIPGWGGTRRLTERAGRSVATRMMLTGQPISASEAKSVGLVDILLPDAAALRTAINDLVNAAAAAAPHATQLIKQILTTADARTSVEVCRDAERAYSREAIDDAETQRRLGAFFEQRERRGSAGRS